MSFDELDEPIFELVGVTEADPLSDVASDVVSEMEPESLETDDVGEDDDSVAVRGHQVVYSVTTPAEVVVAIET